MKKIVGILLLTLLFVSVFFHFNREENISITLLNEDLIARQKLVDKKIEEIKKDEKYSIQKPYIFENPYEISPLTALILFQNKEKEEIIIFLNDKFYGVTKEKKVCISIMGLIANKENKITLTSENRSYHYKIKPKLEGIETFKVKKKGKKEDVYFTSSSSSNLDYIAFNGYGEILFKLNMKSQGEITPLDKDTFLVSCEDIKSVKEVSLFSALYVIDYLGKIRKRIELPYGIHHDLKVLEDGSLMLLGSNEDCPMSLVYRINLKTGEVIDTLDVYSLFKSIDSSYKINDKDKLLGYGLNSLDYKEDTDELLLSFRRLNLIMNLQYKTKTINWMFTNEKEFKNFECYLLKVKNIDFPKGQHEARFIGKDQISFYNNQFDEKNMMSDKLATKQKPAEAVIATINKKEKTITKDLSFQNEKKNSYALGGFKVYKDNYLVNYAYLFKDSSIQKEKSIFDFEGNTYSHIIEYDKQGNILLDFKIDDRLYRIEKRIFSPSISYDVKDFQLINNSLKKEKKLIATKVMDASFLKFYPCAYEVELENDMIGDFALYLKGDALYSIPYQKTKTYFEVPKGNYEIFIKWNGKFYKTKQAIEIE